MWPQRKSKRKLAKYEPDALNLLDQITPQDPNDSLEGISDDSDE